MIYKLRDGRHIDLARVYSIGPVLDDMFGVLPLYKIHVQLSDKPVVRRGSLKKITEEREEVFNAWSKLVQDDKG